MGNALVRDEELQSSKPQDLFASHIAFVVSPSPAEKPLQRRPTLEVEIIPYLTPLDADLIGIHEEVRQTPDSAEMCALFGIAPTPMVCCANLTLIPERATATEVSQLDCDLDNAFEARTETTETVARSLQQTAAKEPAQPVHPAAAQHEVIAQKIASAEIENQAAQRRSALEHTAEIAHLNAMIKQLESALHDRDRTLNDLSSLAPSRHPMGAEVEDLGTAVRGHDQRVAAQDAEIARLKACESLCEQQRKELEQQREAVSVSHEQHALAAAAQAATIENLSADLSLKNTELEKLHEENERLEQQRSETNLSLARKWQHADDNEQLQQEVARLREQLMSTNEVLALQLQGDGAHEVASQVVDSHAEIERLRGLNKDFKEQEIKRAAEMEKIQMELSHLRNQADTTNDEAVAMQFGDQFRARMAVGDY